MAEDPIVELVHRRTIAGWIDVLVLFVLSVILSALSGNAHIGNWTTNDNGFVTHHTGAAINLPTGVFILWAAISFVYYALPELATGQSLGKWVMGLKVITVSGGRLGGRAVIVRTLGRIIDILPVFYLVGWIAMRGPRRPPQRIGDRMAGTTVVAISHP
jgi:uncharacterized RDD family membrane protein YckC